MAYIDPRQKITPVGGAVNPTGGVQWLTGGGGMPSMGPSVGGMLNMPTGGWGLTPQAPQGYNGQPLGGGATTDMGMAGSMARWNAMNPQQQQDWLRQRDIQAGMSDAYVNDPSRSYNQQGGQNYGQMYPGYSQQGGQWQPNGQWNQGGPGVGPNNQLPGYSAYSPYYQALSGMPQTGLIGSEQALNQGQYGSERAVFGGMLGAENALQGSLNPALGQLGQGWGRAQGAMNSMLRTGAGPLEQFVGAGAQTQQLQAALSGALGPEAQAQAFQNYKDSPGQQWLQQQGERAVTRNAAALGGLGGGNVMQELQKQGQGLAAQDFQNQWDRLSGMTGQSIDAAGMLGQLYGQGAGQLAGVAGNLGMAGADLYRGIGSDLANNRYQTGLTIGAGRYGTGQQLASGRTAAGNAIANNVAGTTSALADLVNNQGAGISDLLGQGGGNLANLLSGYGGDQAGSYEQLAQLLANLRMTGTGQMAGLPGLGGPVNTSGLLGGIGDAAAGIGTGITAGRSAGWW